MEAKIWTVLDTWFFSYIKDKDAEGSGPTLFGNKSAVHPSKNPNFKGLPKDYVKKKKADQKIEIKL